MLRRRQLLRACLPLLAAPFFPRPSRAAEPDPGPVEAPDPAFAAANAAYWADPAFGEANEHYWRDLFPAANDYYWRHLAPDAPEPPAPEPAPAPLGSRIAALAGQYTGVPYVAGGQTPRGWDCSGFATWVYAQLGLVLPRTTQAQVTRGNRVAAPQPGDLLFYDTVAPAPGHVGIYLGGDLMVNALNETVGTVLTNIRGPYWTARFYAARRIA